MEEFSSWVSKTWSQFRRFVYWRMRSLKKWLRPLTSRLVRVWGRIRSLRPTHLFLGVTLLAVTIILAMVFVCWPLIASRWLDMVSTNAANDLSKIGDTFGSFNALIGSITLLFIAITLYLQLQEGKRHREDIEWQRAWLMQQSTMEALKEWPDYQDMAAKILSDEYEPGLFYQRPNDDTVAFDNLVAYLLRLEPLVRLGLVDLNAAGKIYKLHVIADKCSDVLGSWEEVEGQAREYKKRLNAFSGWIQKRA